MSGKIVSDDVICIKSYCNTLQSIVFLSCERYICDYYDEECFVYRYGENIKIGATFIFSIFRSHFLDVKSHRDFLITQLIGDEEEEEIEIDK